MLPEHLDTPRETQPRFIFPTLRRRQQRRLNELQAQIGEMAEDAAASAADALFDQMEEVLKDLILFWENQVDEDGEPIGFAAEELDRVVDDGDLILLFTALYEARFISIDQKKSSGQQSGSSTELSTGSLVEGLPTAPPTTPTGLSAQDVTAATPGGSDGLMGSGGSPKQPGPETPTTQEQPTPEPQASRSVC